MTARSFAFAKLPATLTSTPPISEANTAALGSIEEASRSNHQHPRLSSANWQVTNASGEATFTFDRTFPVKPSVAFTYEELADNQPIEFKVKSWITDGSGNYTGCVAKGYRFQALPSSLLNISVLVNFSVTINAPSGINVTCIALRTSS